MSAAEVDLDQLSDSERLALDQYSGVTGQDPAEAIPLLRRSQWNVQVGDHHLRSWCELTRTPQV